jgi:hypothetical protein
MKGFPKHINTKQDVTNLIEEFPVETKAFMKKCLDERKVWLTTGKLASGVAGVMDATHRIAEITDDATKQVVERYQEEFKDDPNCKLFRLGFNVAEAEALLVD